MNNITIQEWFFSEAYGKYDFDLGGSNVQPLTLNNLIQDWGHKSFKLGYADELGDYFLREKIAYKYPNKKVENILVCHGGQEAFSLIARAVKLNKKTEVIIMGSNWSQHTDFSKECGFKINFVSVLDSPDQEIVENIQNHININTAIIILASPDNPTGWCASSYLLTMINELIINSEIVIVVDEEYLIDYQKSASLISEKFAITSSLSKMHGLPGLRLGWIVAHPTLIKQCLHAKRLSTISNSVICENLASIALDKESVYLKKGIKLCLDGINVIKEWADNNTSVELINQSKHLPYAWIRLQRNIESLDFSRQALQQKVLIIPGDVFSQPGFIRLATGRDINLINNGLQILSEILNQ